MEMKFRNGTDQGERSGHATGKLRAVFDPANRSSLDHEMSEANRRLLEQREQESQQWETLRRPDDSNYVVPKNPASDDGCGLGAWDWSPDDPGHQRPASSVSGIANPRLVATNMDFRHLNKHPGRAQLIYLDSEDLPKSS